MEEKNSFTSFNHDENQNENLQSENSNAQINTNDSLKDNKGLSTGSDFEIETNTEIDEQPKDSKIINSSVSSNDDHGEKEKVEEKTEKKPSKTVWKTIGTNAAVAVVSSLLTISIVSNFYYPDPSGDEVQAKDEISESESVTASSQFISTESGTIADIAEQLAPAIVGVVNVKQMQNQFNFQTQNVESGSGSGVVFKKDNKYAYIITNNHVIEGANTVEISLHNGERTEAEVVGADALTDLAVLRIDQKYAEKIASFGDSSSLRPGDEVIAIGNPLGLEFSRTVTQGIISAVDRSISVETSAGAWELNVLQTDAAINPGNSGGALINSHGEVIGINSLKISQEGVEGLGFAIPSNDVVPIAEELIEKGEVQRPYLGVQLYNISDINQIYRQSVYGELNKGIVVAGVAPGSPAAAAGLMTNDLIVGIDGNEVATTTDFRKYLYQNVKPGDTIKVEFYRNGQKQTVSVVTTGN